MENLDYWPLFIVFMIAWVVPMLLSWFEVSKVPSVIVEIIVGVACGPFVLNIISDTPIVSFLADTGFLFLIFLSGLEIDMQKIISSFPKGKVTLSNLLKNSFLLAVFIYFGSLILSLPFAWFISLFMEIDIFFFALLLPTVALSITVPILKADGELSRKFGQVMLMEGAIATVMSIIIISVYSGVLENGFEVELLLFILIFFAFTLVYIIGKQISRKRRFQIILYKLEHAASQIRIRGTVALLMFFVLIAHLINTELVMGAFFAGALLSLFVEKKRSSLLFKLDGMSYGFFIPIFFIMVGVNLDLSSLSQFGESIPFIITLLLGFSITQILPALIMWKVFGLKKALAGGVLLCARMGLTIAAAQIGLNLGVINSAENAGIVISSILISLISPLLYKILNKSEVEEHYEIYILGGLRASIILAERLKMHGISALSIVQKKDLIPEYERKHLNFNYVEQVSEEVISGLNIKTGDLVIVLTESKLLNQELTTFIKEKLHHSKIIARKQSANRKLIGPNSKIKFIDHDEVLASHVESLIVSPDSISSLSESFENYRLEEIQIKRKEIHKRKVKELALPPTGSLVIQKRDGEVFIPHGDTKLLLGDFITVIGNQNALAEFRKTFVGNT
ncbi:cation:proton antiporter [Marivirga arenosa]|uniref:Cation:proton antiporter n=1 Tax=Marivirga arenosa TaxID=3059076 RepID=A0AA49JHY2_9BACT|nr:cation:proton antiporter [Marivirga sp. ABR2-2]WKK83724.2 cation:proton antiporter [Marivirga sp. ABR2-2]